MSWRAREITIVVSLALHGAVAALALNAAHEKKARKATTVALADQEKKKKPEEPKKPPPPPPPPKVAPKVAPPPKVEAAPVAPTPTAPVADTPTTPTQTNISLSNETGMDMGGPKTPGEQKPITPIAPKPPKPGVAPTKTPLHVDAPPPTNTDGGACTEPPGKPEPRAKTDIEYTEEARAAGVEGRLLLEVTVDADGNVTAVKVLAGVDPGLDAAAIATVKTWRFQPAMACGKPVAGGTYKIARRFELGD